MSLYDPGECSDEERAWLAARSDRSFRGDRFRSGFYVTHHFGEPAYLFVGKRDVHVIGRTLDKLIWSYFTKLFLTLEAEACNALHVKAGCVLLDGDAALLIGRGSGGKTVLLSEACRRGGTFVSNTHCIVWDKDLLGVHSPMRVRPDRIFTDRIRQSGAKPHIEAGEYVLQPDRLFERTAQRAKPSCICIVDYRPDKARAIERIAHTDVYDFAELFAFPIITYGIKDDILAAVEGDHFAFNRAYRSMKQRLRELCDRLPAFYVNMDVTQDDQWRSFHTAVFARG